MSYVLSVVSLASMWLYGNRTIAGPISGLVIQALWLIYAIQSREYGFIVSVIGFTVVHYRNLRKWNT
ncbi:MAG: hypothetical protein ACYC27_14715 [Armatimonadota bacterium]